MFWLPQKQYKKKGECWLVTADPFKKKKSFVGCSLSSKAIISLGGGRRVMRQRQRGVCGPRGPRSSDADVVCRGEAVRELICDNCFGELHAPRQCQVQSGSDCTELDTGGAGKMFHGGLMTSHREIGPDAGSEWRNASRRHLPESERGVHGQGGSLDVIGHPNREGQSHFSIFGY